MMPADPRPTGAVGASPSADHPAGFTETHVSMLFFVGDRVYKLRKPVQYDFVDFRLRTARLDDCHREVALNRRLAPDVYLGVADVVMDGEPLDHMVVMRRMPDERRLAQLARRGDALDEWMPQVANVLFQFHRTADRSPEIAADAADSALTETWQELFRETDRFVGPVLDEDAERQIRRLVPTWIEGRGPLLDERIASGCICDGHGDLQAEDIFCLDDGVRILDCVEFSDRLRHCDVCSDVTFLTMDLERLGRADAAGRFLADYEGLSGRRFPESLVHYYTAAHAYVRAMVACLRSHQAGGSGHSEARRLQALALDHLRRARVQLVVIGGPPGSGKSTLAAGLAAVTGLSVIRSDEVRRAVATGVPPAPLTRAGAPEYLQGRYRTEVTAAVYQELLGQAELSLGLGRSVVLDASWIDPGWRRAARLVAERTRSTLVELVCHATPDEASQRVARRLSERTDLSEATPEIGLAMSRSMAPWPSATVIDTSRLSPAAAVAAARDVLASATAADA